MVRAKPDLFLMVPNVMDLETCSRNGLTTPPYYTVSAPPPLVTTEPSSTLSLSLKRSFWESGEFKDEDEDDGATTWTEHRDVPLFNVSDIIYSNWVADFSPIYCTRLEGRFLRLHSIYQECHFFQEG